MKRKIIAGLTFAAIALCAAWLHGATSGGNLRALEQRVADLERRVATLENPEPRFLPIGPKDRPRTP
ncbi:MAG: hypothetical protein OXH15_07105 [Gammaproteobacteria bacterium]|nr:hypothetical protein [Gammaproteobacteria bacterium]